MPGDRVHYNGLFPLQQIKENEGSTQKVPFIFPFCLLYRVGVMFFFFFFDVDRTDTKKKKKKKTNKDALDLDDRKFFILSQNRAPDI
jgi:hypothetical protein